MNFSDALHRYKQKCKMVSLNLVRRVYRAERAAAAAAAAGVRRCCECKSAADVLLVTTGALVVSTFI